MDVHKEGGLSQIVQTGVKKLADFADQQSYGGADKGRRGVQNPKNFADVLNGSPLKEGRESEEAAVSSSMFRWKEEVVNFNLVSIDGVAPRPRLSGSGHPTIGASLD